MFFSAELPSTPLHRWPALTPGMRRKGFRRRPPNPVLDQSTNLVQFFAAGHTGREGSQRVTCGVGESPPRAGGGAAEDKTTEWTRASPAQRSGRGEHAGGAYHGTLQG